jgi:hypothetical protein
MRYGIAPAAFALGAWYSGDWSGFGPFLLCWSVLEYLIYAARYQWNDLRGFAHDQEHNGRRWRARLPAGDTPTRTRRNLPPARP